MANITDPAAIKFGEQLRVLADDYAQFHKHCKEVVFLWAAKGMPALFPDDASAIVMDTANPGVPPNGPDGRTPYTGADANGLIGLAQTFYQGNEASGNAAILLVGKIAVNP